MKTMRLSISKRLRTLMTAVAVAMIALGGMTACSETDNVAESTAQSAAGQAPVYRVSIPATMCGDSKTRGVTFGENNTINSMFKAGEKVYVYNETKQALACANDNHDPIALSPSNISADGKHCTLSGELTFYKFKNSAWEAITVDATDTYSLYYQMNHANAESFVFNYFDYGDQTGTAASASVHDFAEATGVTLTLDNTNNTLTVDNSTVTFHLLQSMFRQTLTFKAPDGTTTVTPTISRLTVESKNGTVLYSYYPLDDYKFRASSEGIRVDINPDGTVSDLYLALTFYYDASHPAAGDQLIVTAFDTDGHVYTCTKDAPEGGFENGQYYYGAMTLTQQPPLTIVNTSTNQPVARKSDGEYQLEGYKSYTVSGVGEGDIIGKNVTLTFVDDTNLKGELIIEGISSIVLSAKVTVFYLTASTGEVSEFGEEYVTITSSGGVRTLSADHIASDSRLRLGDGVTLRIKHGEPSRGYVKNADGSADIAPTYIDDYTVYSVPTIPVNLSTLSADFVAYDGDSMEGTLSGNHKISIADGATVTLNGVTINGTNNVSYPWAGITCKGDATIILADGTTNTVKGFYQNAGISVPVGKTLTIKGATGGTGKLIATGSGTSAGIGGASNASCGNICIEGGIVEANGGGYGAGIGGGYASSANITCGTITITGGTITATGGNSGAPGIGAGTGNDSYRASCGAITISGGTVTASGGNGSSGNGAGIGCGNRSDCASISITDGNVTATGVRNAAGIGTCFKATCGDISVTGGTVTATRGFSSSHDIGRGTEDTSCGTITVSSTVKTSAGKGYTADGTNGYNQEP